MQNPASYPVPPRRSGLPTWVWVLIACGSGCGCLGFIAIFAAILFPVFAQARMKAREVSCMSNVKQMDLAVAMYMQDHNEVMPASRGWMDTLQPYLAGAQKGSASPDMSVFHCPAVPAGDYGYAYNSQLSRKSLADINDPRQAIELYDSSDLTRSASDPVTSLPSPPRHLHNIIGYVDGHAQADAASPNGTQ